jgi:hypothetical protein
VTTVVEFSVRELLAAATERAPLSHTDGKSGALLERVVVDGTSYVVKHCTIETDFVRRLSGDVAGRPWLLRHGGLLADLPHCIDPAIVAVELSGTDVTLVMRDVSRLLLPEGHVPMPLGQHLAFLDHMAELAAAFWGWEDSVGGCAAASRYVMWAPSALATELRRTPVHPVVAIARRGWSRLPARAPGMAAMLHRLFADTTPLLQALDATPHTFVHGDWKCGNLGTHPDGRTVLLDWARGRATPCAELAWYLALNTRRLPHAKDDAIVAYRAALERHGIDTGEWFDRQLDLALLGAMLWFGWEKALDEDDAELAWWAERVDVGARRLRDP